MDEERRLTTFEVYKMCYALTREALLRHMDESEKEFKKRKEAEEPRSRARARSK